MISSRLARLGLSIGLSVVLVAGACRCEHDESNVTPPPLSVTRQTLDERVIEAALSDLATGSDKDVKDFRQSQMHGQIVFSGKCEDGVGSGPWNSEPDEWKSLGRLDRRAIQEAGVDIMHRMQIGEHFTPFHPKNPQILFWEDDPASTQPSRPYWLGGGKQHPMQAAPPGYADQRRLSVVVFAFSWSGNFHGGQVIYVLRFDGTNWNVISRAFEYFT
jgi:hypothetical protein